MFDLSCYILCYYSITHRDDFNQVHTCKVVEFRNLEEQSLNFQCIEEGNRVVFGLGQV